MKFFAKKSLGQNFLIQPQIVKEIVETSDVSDTDTVVEIGPGTGLLTKELLETGAKVIAIEKDNRLIEALGGKFKEYKNFELIHGDILEESINIKGDYKVIANIPYYITGKILRLFLEKENKPSLITVLIQKEVAKRIIAEDQKESILSISIKAYGKPEYVRTVKAGNFAPIPKVDSAVLKISDISGNNFKNVSEKLFFNIVRQGFSSKRKKLSTNLKKYNPDKAFEVCGIEKGLRAEDLKIKDWICLAENLK